MWQNAKKEPASNPRTSSQFRLLAFPVYICGYFSPYTFQAAALWLCLGTRVINSDGVVCPWEDQLREEAWADPVSRQEILESWSRWGRECVGCRWAHLLGSENTCLHGHGCGQREASSWPSTDPFCLGPRYYCSIIVKLWPWFCLPEPFIVENVKFPLTVLHIRHGILIRAS